MEEPADGAMVFAKDLGHYSAGEFYHRDDREGHGDPVDDPEHWWAHDAGRWVSWGEITLRAHRQHLQLIVVAPLTGGWDEAIAALRDSDRFVRWGFKAKPPTGLISDICADYLTAQKPGGQR